jgi:hypothetical protein
MRIARPFRLLLLSSLLAPAAFAQMAPVPSDPLELVTGNARVLVTQEERSAAINLLYRARQNYNMHTGRAPFTLKTSFTSSGQSLYEGDGAMEETWIAGRRWRWTAQISNTTVGRVFYGGRMYSTSTTDSIPLRIYMVRDAIFSPGPGFVTGQMIRSAAVSYNGKEVTCLLLSGHVPTTPASRFWVETEYCIDPNSGLLQVWSEAPGIYITYNYDDAIEFHGHTLARQISFVEDGKTVLDLHLDSLEELHDVDPNLFKPAPEMLAKGPIFGLALPTRFPIRSESAAETDGPYDIQPVIVHATVDNANGKVLEAEALQNSNPTLAQEAVNLVKGSSNSATGVEREVFINVQLHLQRPGRAQNTAP